MLHVWKRIYFVIKLGVSMLFVCFAFGVINNLHNEIFQVPDTPFLENTNSSSPPLFSSSTFQENKNVTPKGKCNIFIGDWIPYETEPLYTSESCSFIDEPQNCIKNGRSDMGYLYWRWNPSGCDLPRFDPNRFLEFMSNKSLALIGDSISRNHLQTLLCSLSEVEKAVLVYYNENYTSRRWLFPSYNFTIDILWSPLLAKATIFEDANGVSTTEMELHLDVLDHTWTEPYPTFDYIILSTGPWFPKSSIYYENNTILGCHSCPKRNFTEINIDFPYRKILKKVFEFIVKSNHKGMIFYRTTAPNHFENGRWSDGGTCNRTVPAKEGEMELSYYDKLLHGIEVEEFEKASIKASENGVNLKLIDVTHLSLLRPDGHAGADRYFEKIAKLKNGKVIGDCLHWCVPGPIDYWNDLLMELVVNG